MTRKFPVTATEYLQLMRRRKWWAIIPIAVIPVAVFLVSLTLPRQYRSETLILVEPQKIPAEYVHTTVTGDVTDRMQTISEEILSRTRLQQIIDDLHLYPKMQGKMSKEAIISMMRKDITVDVITDPRPERHNIASFKISFVASEADVAQQVTNEIANLFIQQNLKLRDIQAQGTSRFIEDELVKARAVLELQEQKVKEFNAAHMGALPEQAESNIQLLSQYQSLAQANSEAIDRAHQQQVYLQSMLSANGTPTGAPVHTPTPQEIELQQKRAELNAARQKYTDSHPDIRRLESEVASAEQQVKAHPQGVAIAGTPAGPNISQQLQGQLVSTQQEIQSRAARQKWLEAQVSGLQGRVASLPSMKSQFADMNRDYIAAQTNYQTLLQKQQDAQMAAALEQHNAGESFRILDPADRPSHPFAPNLPLINGVGILSALFLGILLAFVADMRDATIHDSTEMIRYLDIPLITAIPKINKVQTVPVRQLAGNSQ
jgi:polysaccharide chain length determinant protein (PEP-CTERM system associated)